VRWSTRKGTDLSLRSENPTGSVGGPERPGPGLSEALVGSASDPRSAVLDIRGLSVRYGDGPNALPAVEDVSLTLHRGEVIGLAGESGSGKSTLAYGATRLLRSPGIVTAGEVWFYPKPGEGQAVDLLGATPAELRELRWSEVALVFQSAMHALNPVLTVETQLTDTIAAHRPHMHPTERRDRAAQLLEMVSISPDRLRSYPHELSGGMRQRVMIAMALALEPQVVIMDEPTTALDVVTQREILQQIIDLRDRLGFAVLFITHDLSLLLELADTIAVMYAGRLVEVAPAQAVFRSPRHPYTLGLLRSFPPLHGDVTGLSGIPGSPPDLRHVPSGCAFHPRCPYVFSRCEAEVPRLLPADPGANGEAPRSVACFLGSEGHPRPFELAGRADSASSAWARGEGSGAPESGDPGVVVGSRAPFDGGTAVAGTGRLEGAQSTGAVATNGPDMKNGVDINNTLARPGVSAGAGSGSDE